MQKLENALKNKYGTLILLTIFVLFTSLYLSFYGLVNPQGTKEDMSLHYDGFNPHPLHYKLDYVPKRAIVLRPEVADTIICLGAGESVIAAYISPERRKDLPYYKKYMPNAEILYRELTREQALMLKPDFIVGWRGGFDFKRLGSFAFWNSRGVPTYVEENSGAMPDPYPPFKAKKYPPFSVNNEIQFIRNMGAIFHKEAQAEIQVAKIQEAMRKTKELALAKGPRTVLTMQFRRGQVEVLGDKTLSGNIIREMGCKNIDYEGLLMPLENFLFVNADSIIVIYDYIGGSASLDNQLSMLYRYPYRDIQAVKEGKMGAMQYFDGLVATNVHTADSIWEIYRAIYEPSLEDKRKPRKSPSFFQEMLREM